MKSIARLIKLDCSNIAQKGQEHVKRAFVDTIGVCFPGLKEPVYKKTVDYMNVLGEGPVPIPLGEHRLDCMQAALAWGILSHAIDFDDSCPLLCGHPSVVLLPTIISLAYSKGLTGKQAWEAYISGYEAINRMSYSTSLNQYATGWHTTSSIGIFGSVIAAARLLDLTIDQTEEALGIAASMACGLQANFGTMAKPMHAGLACSNAILAAEMAKRGATSSRDSFDGNFSYFNIYGGEKPENLPDDIYFADDGITVKPYPSCGCTTRANDLALQLYKQGIKTEDIDSIEFTISALTQNCLRYVIPHNSVEAKFSLEYCFAICLTKGAEVIADFEDNYVKQQIENEPISSLFPKMSRKIGEDLGKEVPFKDEYLAVKVLMKDGREISLREDVPKGFPNNPLTEDEIKTKFMGCISGYGNKEEQEQLYAQLRHIDEQDDFAAIIDKIVTLANKH